MQITDRAVNYYRSGYNCAEAVLLAAAESYDLGLSSREVRLATGFGGGLGRGHICGALTGAVIALGAALGRESTQQDQAPFKEIREELISAFELELGSLHCADLKTGNREDCEEYVRAAAASLAKVLDKNK